MSQRYIACTQASKFVARKFSKEKKYHSFSEDIVRPFLKKTIRNVEESWAYGTSTIRKTLLETLMDDSTKLKLQHLPSKPTAIEDAKIAPRPTEMPVHPILGKCIHDLGYKSIFVTNIKSLVNAAVWEKQRTLRSARAALIAESKIKSNTVNYIPGIIALYRNKLTSEVGIFDGQHRVAALYILAQKNKWDMNDFNILIEVYDIENAESDASMEMVRQLFKEINSAEPVSLIDMDAVDDSEEESRSPLPSSPSSAAVTPVESKMSLKPHDIKHIIDHVCQSLQEIYEPMFKPSKRCRPPHVNIDKLRDDIYEQKEHIFDGSIQNPHDLVQKIEQYNASMNMKTEAELLEVCYASKKATPNKLKVIEKAKQHQFYLGLDPMWMHK